jgi:thiol-disulfide isomerase/thioredoxin
MMMKTPDQQVRQRHKLIIWSAALLISAVVGLAFHYAATEFPTMQSDSRSVTAAQSGAASDSFSFSFFDQPRAIPELSFIDGDGHARSLADFKGRPVLLNIWATWCAPCRKEMPSLDRLQADHDLSQLVVLPLSLGRQGLPVVKKFYDELGLRSIGIFLDQSRVTASKVNAVGLPTTLFIDRDGREIGRKNGPAEWDSAEVVTLVRERLGLTSAQMDNR